MPKIKIMKSYIVYKVDTMTVDEFERLIAAEGLVLSELKSHFTGGFWVDEEVHVELTPSGGIVSTQCCSLPGL